MDDCATRAATVTEAGPEKLLLRIDRDGEDREAHQGCRCCAMKGLCRGGGDGTITVAIPSEAGLAVGDRVAVRYSAANPALAAFILFAPALLGLAAGGFAALRLAPGGDGAFLAGCLIGLAAGVGVTFAANRSLTSLKPRARIVEKL